MINSITSPVYKPSPILPVESAGSAASIPASGQTASVFRSILADSIQQVSNMQVIAGKTVEQFLSGENQDLHQVAIASQKAELSFEFFLQARNKVVAAYQEVMRMQL